MAVFVNTANRSIVPLPRAPLSPAAGRARDQVFLDLLPRGPALAKIRKPQETSLYEAFLAVWEQFEGDDDQKAVCVRILAFHFLMERTRGSLVEEWLRPSPENPETVILDDAVVAAVGSVALGTNGSLLEESFLLAVRTHFQGRTEDRSAPGKAIQIGSVQIPASQKPASTNFDHRDVAAHLLTHQSKATGVSEGELAVVSQICEKLRLALTAMVGSESFHALFVRALALGKRENAGLADLRVNKNGTLGGTCASTQAGIVLIAHLINGPAILIGETLVRSMLHEVWPELSFSGPSRDEPQSASRAA